jgi:4-hydroxybenzoate polyprenyltransferase
VQGRIQWWPAILEWLGLGALGVGLAFHLNRVFGVVALTLWLMGCVYNIPPVRSKELPYVDVLSESLNNPLRLLLGWHALIVDRFPPVSLILAYWMLGAFFMATKRLAEYRHIGDKETAAAYRSSFRHYDADRLLVSIVFYVTLAALFFGIFIVRYKLELIVAVPGLAAFLAYYSPVGLLTTARRGSGSDSGLSCSLSSLGYLVHPAHAHDIPVLCDLHFGPFAGALAARRWNPGVADPRRPAPPRAAAFASAGR